MGHQKAKFLLDHCKVCVGGTLGTWNRAEHRSTCQPRVPQLYSPFHFRSLHITSQSDHNCSFDLESQCVLCASRLNSPSSTLASAEQLSAITVDFPHSLISPYLSPSYLWTTLQPCSRYHSYTIHSRCSKPDSELKSFYTSATPSLKSSWPPQIWRRGRRLSGRLFKNSRSAKG
jgi:hypothetical protein